MIYGRIAPRFVPECALIWLSQGNNCPQSQHCGVVFFKANSE